MGMENVLDLAQHPRDIEAHSHCSDLTSSSTKPPNKDSPPFCPTENRAHIITRHRSVLTDSPPGLAASMVDHNDIPEEDEPLPVSDNTSSHSTEFDDVHDPNDDFVDDFAGDLVDDFIDDIDTDVTPKYTPKLKTNQFDHLLA
ncbi:hypothetical protein PIB30_006908 [Stylosanthes scabra]|uniref:Uncharacterized protein n=1 Tax=Stylosanthes scabra TaxID=79078 RepID=A0ABU6X2T5_9FABA|nr:hypothetical protein [Stylosanthes scabra]